MDWHVGQLVVFIGRNGGGYYTRKPKPNEAGPWDRTRIYTIREIISIPQFSPHLALRFEEIVLPKDGTAEPVFVSCDFRPVRDSSKAVAALREAMLNLRRAATTNKPPAQ